MSAPAFPTGPSPAQPRVSPGLALPKRLLVVGAHALTWRTRRRLQRPSAATGAQRDIHRSLTRQLAGTWYGRRHGITAAMSYASFQGNVPLCTYEHLAPAIERMKRGEADVLWPGTCAFYAVSSGTTTGRTKYLPVTSPLRAHFNRAGLDSLLYYTARVGRTQVFRGRHLFLGGSTTLAAIPGTAPFAAYAGDLSALAALAMPATIARHLYEPGAEIAQMADWPEKIAAIVRKTLHLDISLVAGIPSWLLILAEALRDAGTTATTTPRDLRTLWPNLECLVHGGVPIGPFREDLRRAFGPTINFHEVYPASEGFIAAQDDAPEAGLRLMANAGLFFEFLPVRAFDPARLPTLGTQAVPLEGVRVGEDYVLILTTPAGLCRYVIGDIVRFTSTEPPRLVYAGRTALQLSAFGEHVIERELTDSLLAACGSGAGPIANFHVAPLFNTSRTAQDRGRHEWWIELRSAGGSTPADTVLAARLDAELMARNDDYEAKRKGGGLEAPSVRLVAPGTFERWLRHNGKWGGQNKVPRCRSDRAVADELARVARSPE